MVCDLRSEFERRSAVGPLAHRREPPRLYLDIRNDARAGHSELIETIRKEPNPAGVHRGMMLIYRGMAAAFAPVLPQFFSHICSSRATFRWLSIATPARTARDLFAPSFSQRSASRIGTSSPTTCSPRSASTGKQLSVDLVDTFSAFVGVPLTAEALQVALDVRPEYLDAAMQSLEADYGGIDGYLQTVGGLGPSGPRAAAQQLAALGAADLPVSRRPKCHRPSKPTRPWFIAMRRR